MKLYYYKSVEGNFGDDLNQWLWNDLLPGFFDEKDDTRFSGIGTIINTSMPRADKWIVFSSGIGYGYPPESFGNQSWDVVSVRGPLSAKILGLPLDKVVTDGAALLSVLPEFQPVPVNKRSGIIFIPHHKALETGKWEKVCREASVEFVDPRSEAKFVINKIRNSKLVLADAMHAAIIADAMRVPWVPLTTSNEINSFKWIDWASTISIDYKPINIGVSTFREAIRSSTLALYGEKYLVPSFDAEDCIRNFETNRDLKKKKWWRNYVRIVRMVFFRIPNRILLVIDNKFGINFDSFFTKRAIKNMENASKQNGFLSKDEVFYSNVDALQEKLKYVKSIYSKSNQS